MVKEIFKEGEKALIDWGTYKSECTVQYLTKDKWYYVQLDNGGMHYTRRLIKKDSPWDADLNG